MPITKLNIRAEITQIETDTSCTNMAAYEATVWVKTNVMEIMRTQKWINLNELKNIRNTNQLEILLDWEVLNLWDEKLERISLYLKHQSLLTTPDQKFDCLCFLHLMMWIKYSPGEVVPSLFHYYHFDENASIWNYIFHIILNEDRTWNIVHGSIYLWNNLFLWKWWSENTLKCLSLEETNKYFWSTLTLIIVPKIEPNISFVGIWNLTSLEFRQHLI